MDSRLNRLNEAVLKSIHNRMSWSRNKNNIPVNPSFLYIMWCLEGCSSHGLVNMIIELLVHEKTISSFSMC